MASRRVLRWISRGVAATAALNVAILSALPASAAPWSGQFEFANQDFRNVWAETDQAPGDRSWTWGPKPWFDYREFYKQSPRGLRQVQYFDKARMEINDPEADKGRFYVTNGLLPVEMISGRVKLGDANTADQYEQREAAQIPVAGDPAKDNPNAPTYSSFRFVASTNNDNPATPALGQKVSATFSKSGSIGQRADLATDATTIVEFNAVTKHNIPRVFRDYMAFYDRAGGVTSLFAFGLPVTEPYWIQARVGGAEKDIMAQIFERRVLTYTPSNPAAFQVEMGNVGQHYFQWRYAKLGAPWVNQPAYIPISFGSTRRSQANFNIFTTDASGARQNPITSGAAESLPFSTLRSWDEANVRIVGDTRRDGKRQLYSWKIDGSEATRLTTSTANDYNGAVSPDGKKIAFASDRAGAGKTDIWLMNIDGGGMVNLTKTAAACVNEYPTWFPDGSAIAYNSNCGGNWEIWVADLSYAQDKGNDLQASLVTPTNISKNAAADRYPRVSPAGQHIAFRSDRDGNGEIYVFRSRTGQALRQFTNTSGQDNDHSAPSWSPDGRQLVYDSNVEGDYEIYSRNEDGTGGERKLTDNSNDDRWPIWAQ